jgi:multicomponent Na+:H+ antiporter subunit F
VAEFLTAMATIVTILTGIGLARMLRGPSAADRMMSAQLIGTGGAAAALLIATASGVAAIIDIALTLAVLAAFSAVALSMGEPGSRRRTETTRGE